MSKYITNFETTADFNAVKDNLDKPNVALTLDDELVHYIPINPLELALLILIDAGYKPNNILSVIFEEGWNSNILLCGGMKNGQASGAVIFGTPDKNLCVLARTNDSTVELESVYTDNGYETQDVYVFGLDLNGDGLSAEIFTCAVPLSAFNCLIGQLVGEY